MATATRLFGSSIKRREDPRFITGRGKFTDDVKLPGTAFAVFVRSPHAHARIKSINVAKAKATAGVVAVFTGRDLADAKVGGLPCGWLLPGIKLPPHPVLAVEKVRYVGDAVAVVIGENVYGAKDAAERVEVAYEILAAVTDATKTVEKGAPTVHTDAPGNVCFT